MNTCEELWTTVEVVFLVIFVAVVTSIFSLLAMAMANSAKQQDRAIGIDDDE